MNANSIKEFLSEVSNIMALNKDYLIELDSVVGDGDLGLTMSDGFLAAYNGIASSQEKDIGKLLYMAGKAMGNAVPSTMGTLMSSGFMNAGKNLKGKEELTNIDIVDMFRGYMNGVSNLGKAKIGEKTFLDGIAPAVTAMEKAVSEGDSIQILAQKGADAAKEGVKNTTTMKAMHGRAAIRGDASISLVDPGAVVASLIFEAFLNYVNKNMVS